MNRMWGRGVVSTWADFTVRTAANPANKMITNVVRHFMYSSEDFGNQKISSFDRTTFRVNYTLRYPTLLSV